MKSFAAPVLAGALALGAAGCVTASRHVAGAPPAPEEAAVIRVPANIDIIAFDGEKLAIDYMPMYGESNLEVFPGEHRLRLRYSGLSDGATFDQKQVLYSPPVELHFKAEKKGDYRIKYRVPAVDMRIDKEISSLTAWVEDEKTKTPVCQPATSGSAAAAKTAPVPAGTQPGAEAAAEPVRAARPPLEELQYWWGRASERERGEFLKWSVMRK